MNAFPGRSRVAAAQPQALGGLLAGDATKKVAAGKIVKSDLQTLTHALHFAPSGFDAASRGNRSGIVSHKRRAIGSGVGLRFRLFVDLLLLIEMRLVRLISGFVRVSELLEECR